MTKATTKPNLARDWDPLKLKEKDFPVIAMPKIDGVRAMTLDGPLTGRSLKKLGNRHVNKVFDIPEFAHFDGEMAANHECHPDLCRITTSALSSYDGEPQILWHLFDYVNDQTRNLPYIDRLAMLELRVHLLHTMGHQGITVVPYRVCHNMAELLAFDDENLIAGYEGTVYRKPKSKHKQGRATLTEGELIRIKRFVEADARVDSITEGNKNGNVAQTNELGKTFRTSHQENMIPNGMIGNMLCTLMEDVKDAHSGKLLLSKGDKITVSPGNMTEEEAKLFFAKPELIVNWIIKFKFFPKGIKDKPRFPTYVTRRALFDIVSE